MSDYLSRVTREPQPQSRCQADWGNAMTTQKCLNIEGHRGEHRDALDHLWTDDGPVHRRVTASPYTVTVEPCWSAGGGHDVSCHTVTTWTGEGSDKRRIGEAHECCDPHAHLYAIELTERYQAAAALFSGN